MQTRAWLSSGDRAGVRTAMIKVRAVPALLPITPACRPHPDDRLIATRRLCPPPGFQGAAHQRWRGHFARNLLALIPKSHKDMVAALFRTIFAQPDPAAVSAAWEEVRDQLVKTFPKVGPLMDDAKAEVLAFTAFPKPHWVK